MDLCDDLWTMIVKPGYLARGQQEVFGGKHCGRPTMERRGSIQVNDLHHDGFSSISPTLPPNYLLAVLI